jgi:structure-specific endonuclease subunit SLX1
MNLNTNPTNPPNSTNPTNTWYCYLIRSLRLKENNHTYSNRTYVGKTNDPLRRIKQHNGILAGGAKRTMELRPCEMYCIMEGFPTEKDALKFEWFLAHPTRHPRNKNVPSKLKGVQGKLNALAYILEKRPLEYTITIYIEDEFKSFMENITKHLNINNNIIILPFNHFTSI